MKYSKSKIDKYRKNKKMNVLIGNFFYSLDGSLSGMEKRLWEECKQLNVKYEDGSTPKKNELFISVDHYCDEIEIEIYARKEVPETDEEVIARLEKEDKRLKTLAMTKKRKAQEDAIRERQLYDKLKAKYETGETQE